MYIQRLAKIALCAVMLLVCGSIVMGQAMTPEERQRIMRVQDVEAAGNSDDKSFIPFLKAVLQSRKQDHQNWDRPQMALAKLGEQEQQQQILCVFTAAIIFERRTPGSANCLTSVDGFPSGCILKCLPINRSTRIG